MQVGFRDLTIWSFLMASAHGAGLMVLPLVIGRPAEVQAAGSAHAHSLALSDAFALPLSGVLAVHTLTYLGVTALVAWIIFAHVGLAILRTAWFNIDWLWACMLVATGVIVLIA